MISSMDISILLDFAKLLIVPLTVSIVAFALRPLLRVVIDRATAVKFSRIDFTKIDDGEETPSIADVGISDRYLLPRNIEDTPKDKIEKLRLALETEQINQLIAYHANSLAQSKISFWFSLGAATLGFLVIIMGVMFVVTGGIGSGSILTVTSGTIIDAVAALFFAQSTQARKSMTEFFDKLRIDRQFNESLRLAESMRDGEIKNILKAQLSLFFAGYPSGGASDKFFERVRPIQTKQKVVDAGTGGSAA
jgi:Cyanobacterial TRADD-N associated 2-Transmembrane domain